MFFFRYLWEVKLYVGREVRVERWWYEQQFSEFPSAIHFSKELVIGISKKNTINNYILSMYDVNEEN